MTDPDKVLAKLREASRYTIMAMESLQTAKDSEVLREKMILKADEDLREVDSSGFTTCRFVQWTKAKYSDPKLMEKPIGLRCI